MGTITQFHFKINLIKNLPAEVIDVLSLVNANIENRQEYRNRIEEANTDIFFNCNRWYALFSHNAFHEKIPTLRHRLRGTSTLELHGELLNYDNETKKFLNWISPYIAGRKKSIYLGWTKADTIRTTVFHHWWLPHERRVVYGTSRESAMA